MTELINSFFTAISSFFSQFFFFDILFFVEGIEAPLVVFAVFCSSVFFTFKMGFINIRLFRHAVALTSGSLDKGKNKEGEISHFKALTTALSATVGLGNIAGVAIAISVGGPGAVFWMLVMGFFGMSTKFTECSLATMFRKQRADGHLMGGPMEYLQSGFQAMNWPKLGKALAIVFSCLCIGGSFGGGVAFQVNQSLNAVSMSFPFLKNFQWVYGLFLIVLVGAVIIGGIKRIAEVSSRVVPLMFLIYMIMSFFVLITHYEEIPKVFTLIFQKAFSMSAGLGGFFGVLVTGLQRAAFSSEVGLGSSPIAHAVAKVEHPVEEGVVALLEPFLDTIVICLTTALVILVTGVYNDPELAHLVSGQKGAALTSQALAQASSIFPFILSISVFLFAFSTIVSWTYYGERCFSFVFSEKYALIYKIMVLVVIFCGAVATSTVIMDFCDLMILSMALPNLIGLLAFSGKVKKSLNEYMNHLKK